MTGQTAALVFGTAGVTAVIKAIGPIAFGGRELPARLASVVRLLAPPLLAGLVVTQALANGKHLAVDADTAGVAVAGAAAVLKAPIVACVLLAAGVSALIRLGT